MIFSFNRLYIRIALRLCIPHALLIYITSLYTFVYILYMCVLGAGQAPRPDPHPLFLPIFCIHASVLFF